MNLYQKPVSSDSDIHNNIPLTVLEFYSANYMPEEPGMLDYETGGLWVLLGAVFTKEPNLRILDILII